MSKRSLLFVFLVCQLFVACSSKFEEKEPLLIPPAFEGEYRGYRGNNKNSEKNKK